MKKIINYALAATLLSMVTFSSTYTFLHLKMTEAYNTKDYQNVYKYAHLL